MSHDERQEELREDLALLLTGELDRSRTLEVVGHLRECDECRRELAGAAGVHAALLSARRTLEPVRQQPVSAWAAAEAELSADDPLPPLSLPSRSDLAPRRTPSRGPAARRLGLAAVACVAALAIVATALGLSGHWPGRGRPVAVEVRHAALVPVAGPGGEPGARGEVSMSSPAGRTDMTIRTSGLARPAPGHFYYAWLLDPTTSKMLPLGVVSATDPATFEVDAALVARYAAVDISLQSDDGNPAHSAVSVLRATYA